MSEQEDHHIELKPGDPGYEFGDVNQYEEMFQQAKSEVIPADERQQGRLSRLVNRLRKQNAQAPELEGTENLPVDEADRQSWHYIEQNVWKYGIENKFRTGIHVYPHDPGVKEESRMMSMNYPVQRSDGTIENGWETVLIGDHIEAWHAAESGDDNEALCKQYTIDSWLDMQKTIVDKHAEQKRRQEEQDKLELDIATQAANERFGYKPKPFDHDEEYQRLLNEANQSGDNTQLKTYTSAALTKRMDEEMPDVTFVDYRPFFNRRDSDSDPQPEFIPLDKIVSVHSWENWRGRSNGRGEKRDKIRAMATNSKDHIVRLAMLKEVGEFDPGKEDRITAVKLVDTKGGSYYCIATGGHRVSSEKLLSEAEGIQAQVTFAGTYTGDFGKVVEQEAKEKIKNRILSDFQQARYDREHATHR